MGVKLYILIIGIFVIGWMSSLVYSEMFEQNIETPAYRFSSALERNSPSDWIKQDQIHVYKDQVIIDLDNPIWSVYTDTNSMDPLIDVTANGLEIVPNKPEQINLGDVISYRSNHIDAILIHRVIEKGSDEQGHYFICKGDNNKEADPEKVRFNQVTGVLVGVLY